MIRIKKYIAILLLGIFISPITFQSFHIVWHHSHGSHGDHELCHIKVSAKPLCSVIKTVSQKDKHCLICEYQFPINDLPKVSIFRSITPVIKSSLNEFGIQLYFQQVFSNKSPRAPPTLYS